MTISEIRKATVAVRDLDLARRYYETTFDYISHGEADVAGTGYESLWNMPAGMTGKAALLGPAGATTGLLQLVQFDQPGKRIWGDYQHPENYGHYALNIRVPKIQPAIDKILEHGGRSKAKPTHWTVSAEISAWDSLSYDPDGNILDVFELEPAPGSLLAAYDGRCSSLQTVALHVSDARRSARFYAALGYRPWYDKMLENMESFFNIPKGTSLHNINMVRGDASLGRIEIAQYVGWPGQSQRKVAVPPNTGILSIAMETDDLDATMRLLTSIGTEPCSAAVEVRAPLLGNVRARSYYGPDDELLEFYQRI